MCILKNDDERNPHLSTKISLSFIKTDYYKMDYLILVLYQKFWFNLKIFRQSIERKHY